MSYLLHPESYRFGTEAGGWAYRSRAHHLGCTLVGLSIALGGGVLSLLSSDASRSLAIRLFAVLLDLIFLAATASKS